MDQDITIRPIYNNFSDEIIGLILPIQQQEFNVPVTLADQPDLQDIEKHYHDNGGCFWGVFKNDELIGTIGLMALGHRAGAIRKMFVKEKFRGKVHGVAQLALETMISYCKEKNITHLYLGTVGLLKAAIRFYEKNGFEPIDKEKLPDYFPRMQADHIFYHLRLGNAK